MALIIPLRGFTPKMGENCFLAENATIIGDVTMGDGCSVWFNTVLRGDVNTITIGNCVNIQDGSVLHTLYKKSTIEIGDYVSIGHNVTIHGSKIRSYALIGMGAVVMDDAEVGEGAIVAAGAVVPMDAVIYGSDNAKIAYIISNSSGAIAQKLLAMDLGITLLDGRGGFSGDRKQVVLCAFKRSQIAAIKAAVTAIDPSAFIIVCEAHEVLGEGFSEYTPDSL